MFKGIPFVMISGSLLTGILLANVIPYVPVSYYAAILVFLFLIGYIYVHKKQNSPSFIILVLFWGVMGMYRSSQVDIEFIQTQQQLSQDHEGFVAQITSLPEKQTNGQRYLATISQLNRSGTWEPVQAKAYLTFDSEDIRLFEPNQTLVVAGTLRFPFESTPLRPFNYRAFLKHQGIHATARVRRDQYEVLATDRLRDARYYVLKAARWVDSVLITHLEERESYGLIKAMLLGRKDGISEEQMARYSQSGAIHVLAVSGLHVGIIFMIFSTLFAGIKSFRFGRWLYVLLLYSVLLGYAALTGFPPSVQRATLMCAVWVMAEVIQRKNHSLNTLFLAATFLLLLDPPLLYQLGFQLSFLAVLGILVLYPRLHFWVNSRYRILNYLWQISVIGIAAQLFTSPVSLYYFHQFPIYFWIVNPFVVTLASVVLTLTISLLVAQFFIPIPLLLSGLSILVEYSAYAMNTVVAIPDYLPWGVITGISFETWQVVLAYLLGFGCLIVFYTRKAFHAQLVLGCILLCIALSALSGFQIYTKSEWLLSPTYGNVRILAKEGDQLYVFNTDSLKEPTKEELKTYMAKNRINRVGSWPSPVLVDQLNTLVTYQNRHLYIADKFPSLSPAIDYVVLSGAKYPRKEPIRINSETTYLLVNMGIKTRQEWKRRLEDAGAKRVFLVQPGEVFVLNQ